MSTGAVPPRPRPALRDVAGLLSGTVMLGLGERLAERFIPVALSRLGGGALAVGLYQSATNLVGAAASLPGGVITDRLGSKRALQWFALVSVSGFVVLAFAAHWTVAVAGALLALSWSAISLPAMLTTITRAIPARNTAWGVTVHSLIRRVPMAIGPLIAGAMMTRWGEGEGLRAAFLLATALGVATLIAQQMLLARAATPAGGAGAGAAPAFSPLVALRSMSPPLRRLFVADTLIRFCEQIPYAFVVLWCMRVIAQPVTALQFGQLTAIEMVAAMLVYLPGAWLSSRIGKPVTVAITFVFFFAFPLVLLAGTSFPMLVLAFVLRGMKELGEPTRKSLILDLCPSDARATYFGWYYCVRDSLAAIAAAGGALLWASSPHTTLLVSSAFGLVGTVWYAWVALRPVRSRP